MYVYLWAKVMPFTSAKCLTICFVVLNVLLWVLTIVLETIAILESFGTIGTQNASDPGLQCGNPVYNSIICILAIMQLIIAIAFAVYGIRLMCVLRKSVVSSRRDTNSRKRVRACIVEMFCFST